MEHMFAIKTRFPFATFVVLKGCWSINLFNVPRTTLNLALDFRPFHFSPLKEYCNLGVLTCFQIR